MIKRKLVGHFFEFYAQDLYAVGLNGINALSENQSQDLKFMIEMETLGQVAHLTSIQLTHELELMQTVVVSSQIYKHIAFNWLMGASCRSCIEYSSLSLEELNKYTPKQKYSVQKLEHILRKLYPSIQTFEDSQICLASYIYEKHKNGKQFQDPNFSQLELSVESGRSYHKQTNYLHKLYNYKHMAMDRVYHTSTGPNAFQQHELELCYCSAVFYCICSHQELKEKIFVTRDINEYNAYVLRLFCTGAEIQVIVDDRIPLKSDGIKYAEINGKEIWPILLEKAWCKQIGGYDKAKALSPEDCFEEITGIPTQSYAFREINEKTCREMLIDAVRSDYWVCLTAYVTGSLEHNVRSRQVFCLQGVSYDDSSFNIRSPYLDSNIQRMSNQTDGDASLSIGEIYNYFEYFTIGYYHKGFYLDTMSVSSFKNEEIFYELEVLKEQQMNIRFQQFYQEYLINQVEKQLYSYSPSLFEIYDYDTKQLIEDCKGLGSGARSINLSTNIMLDLKAKKYYLRVQVDWKTPDMLQTGNIVIYSQRGRQSYSLKKHRPLEHDKQLDLWAELMASSLQKAENVFNSKEQEVEARLLEKKSRDILGIRNTSDQQSKITVYFKGSENISINHYRLERDRLHLDLGANQQRVLELMPKDVQEPYRLSPFQVFKEVNQQ